MQYKIKEQNITDCGVWKENTSSSFTMMWDEWDEVKKRKKDENIWRGKHLGAPGDQRKLFYWLNLFVESTYFCTAKVSGIFLQSYSSELLTRVTSVKSANHNWLTHWVSDSLTSLLEHLMTLKIKKMRFTVLLRYDTQITWALASLQPKYKV